MKIQNEIKIISTTLISSKVLQIQFNVDWTMDDANELTKKILLLTAMNMIEVTQGADLQSARLKADDYELLLNFEEYSHSCWLECISDADRHGLLIINKIINQAHDLSG